MRSIKLMLIPATLLGTSALLLGSFAPIASSTSKQVASVKPPATQSDSMAAPSAPKVVKITAKRFAFTPNQITLKKGEPVTLELTSEDVTHGFYMKPLKLDEVIVPGKPTQVHITPQAAGKFTTICDHFCGAGHGNMNMTIIVEE